MDETLTLDALTWLTELELVALKALPVTVQSQLIEAAQDITSGEPNAPGYRKAARIHQVVDHQELLEVIAGPVRKGAERVDWSRLLDGLLGEGSRTRARARARASQHAKEHLKLVTGRDLVESPDETTDETERDAPPVMIWPRGWPPKKARAADYLLAGATTGEAAAACDLSPSTTSRWWNTDREFRTAVEAQRRALNEHRMQQVHHLRDAVLDELSKRVSVMEDKDLIRLLPHLMDRTGMVKTERVEMTHEVQAVLPDPDLARRRLEQTQEELEERRRLLREARARRAIDTTAEGSG